MPIRRNHVDAIKVGDHVAWLGASDETTLMRGVVVKRFRVTGGVLVRWYRDSLGDAHANPGGPWQYNEGSLLRVCANCDEPRSAHAEDKCIFGSTSWR